MDTESSYYRLYESAQEIEWRVGEAEAKAPPGYAPAAAIEVLKRPDGETRFVILGGPVEAPLPDDDLGQHNCDLCGCPTVGPHSLAWGYFMKTQLADFEAAFGVPPAAVEGQGGFVTAEAVLRLADIEMWTNGMRLLIRVPEAIRPEKNRGEIWGTIDTAYRPAMLAQVATMLLGQEDADETDQGD